MNEAFDIWMPNQKRIMMPVTSRVSSLSGERKDEAARRDSINLENMVHVELVNLLEQIRCEYYMLLNSEPDEECLQTYFQWQDEIAGLRSKMFRIRELLAVA